MTKTGWIVVAVGVVGAGALALFKLGKKAAIPSAYQEGSTGVANPFPFEEVTSSTPKNVVEQAEVATEIAEKAAARQVQLVAEKAGLEQRAEFVESSLNSVLADQTPGAVAHAQALDAERQSLLAQMAANDAAMTQTVATSDAAQQSIDSATQALLLANEREQVALNAQANAEADRKARELEIAKQAQATADLNPKSTPVVEPAISLPAPTTKQVQNNEVKWQQALQLLIQLWMNDYPKQTTNALRLAWFQKLETGIAETEKLFPGFNAWLVSTNKALLSKMASEKKKVSMEVKGVTPVDPKLAVWKTASVLTLDYWTKVYPKQEDIDKAKGLIAIVAATKATEQSASGYMRWFESTYPGVSARMIAEGTRLQNVAAPGSDALVTKPIAPLLKPIVLAAKPAVDPKPIMKMPVIPQTLQLPKKAQVAPRPIQPKTGVGARPVAKSNVATVANFVTQAKVLRDTAKVLTATNNVQSIANKQLVRVMGR